MKHCIDCKYYLEPGFCGQTVKLPDVCSAYTGWLVRGGPEPTDSNDRHYRCETERIGIEGADCGVDGRFFEPKITDPEPGPIAA